MKKKSARKIAKKAAKRGPKKVKKQKHWGAGYRVGTVDGKPAVTTHELHPIDAERVGVQTGSRFAQYSASVASLVFADTPVKAVKKYVTDLKLLIRGEKAKMKSLVQDLNAAVKLLAKEQKAKKRVAKLLRS